MHILKNPFLLRFQLTPLLSAFLVLNLKIISNHYYNLTALLALLIFLSLDEQLVS